MEVGHNANADRAVAAYHLSELMKAKDKKASADGEYSSYLAKLQAKGMEIDAAKEALKLKKSGKVGEKALFVQRLAFYCDILGCPLQIDQPDLFQKPTESQSPEERAEEQGFGNGILGEGQDKSPHAFETPLGQAWLKGWNAGCAERHKVAQAEQAEQAAEAEQSSDPDEDQTDIEDEAA